MFKAIEHVHGVNVSSGTLHVVPEASSALSTAA